MKLSTKGRYGVKAMFDLALHHGNLPISLKSVAERQGISEPYLEQLISSLRKANLVKSVRGAQGGYILNYEPQSIRIGDIIRVLEGPLAPTGCVLEDDPVECVKADGCVTKLVWAKIRDSINHVIDSITLQDMLEDYKNIHQDDEYMFYI